LIQVGMNGLIFRELKTLDAKFIGLPRLTTFVETTIVLVIAAFFAAALTVPEASVFRQC